MSINFSVDHFFSDKQLKKILRLYFISRNGIMCIGIRPARNSKIFFNERNETARHKKLFRYETKHPKFYETKQNETFKFWKKYKHFFIYSMLNSYYKHIIMKKDIRATLKLKNYRKTKMKNTENRKSRFRCSSGIC